MASGGRGASGDGAAVLQELRARSPAELARWALGQARELAAAGARPEALPVAKLAAAVPAAPREDLEALVRSAIAGFAELPAQERADSVRLALRGAELVAQPGHDVEQAAAPPPLVVNLLKVANSAHLEKVPPETWGALAEAAEAEVKESVRPQHVADVLKQLDEGERSQLTDILVETKVVPEAQRSTVDEVFKPGGHADKLHTGLSWAMAVRRWSPALLLLPVVECMLAYGPLMQGGGTLASWLRFDCWLTFGLVAAMAYTMSASMPLVDVLGKDPLGAVRRASETSGPEAALRAALPGVPLSHMKRVAAGAVAAVALALCSLCWGALGALLVPVAALSRCSPLPFLISVLVIGLRLGSAAPIVRVYAFARRHLLSQRSEPSIPTGEYAPLRR